MASTASLAALSACLNVADRLTTWATKLPTEIAVSENCRAAARQTEHDPPNVHCQGRHRGPSGTSYLNVSFFDLDANATRIARGLVHWGVRPGTRIALLVKPGIDFVTLVFALLRAGAVIVLIDPGLGRRNLVRSLSAAEPEGFIAIPLAQAIRLLLRHRFPRAKWNVTIGRRWFWRGLTLGEVIARGWSDETPLPETRADDPAAIIFTSGSTGPPKGVLYTQRMFDTQVGEIQAKYGIQPGGIDLACFPLFALFNAAMGVTTVFPEMDFSRPASVAPKKLLAAATDWQVTQAFASPAVWRNVSNYCERNGERIDSLRQVLSCGAPVSADVLRKTLACVARGAKMHTPYGATECLPVSTIEAAEVLGETAVRTDAGAGVCVGRKFDTIEWRVIRITDEPIESIDEAEGLPVGEVGELIVRGPQVSPEYVTGDAANTLSKIGVPSTEYLVLSTQRGRLLNAAPASSPDVWHRTGDVGYLDEQARFWYCGRKSQRVETSAGTMYTEIYEAIFNRHPKVRRSALVGIGPRGNQKPVMILECTSPVTDEEVDAMKQETEGGPVMAVGEIIAVDWPLPVDVRHNAKINREKLAAWAAKELASGFPKPRSPRP
jgi:acyl-CoA synthetase (AMP-forming)/AMP-acid ligase II